MNNWKSLHLVWIGQVLLYVLSCVSYMYGSGSISSCSGELKRSPKQNIYRMYFTCFFSPCFYFLNMSVNHSVIETANSFGHVVKKKKKSSAKKKIYRMHLTGYCFSKKPLLMSKLRNLKFNCKTNHISCFTSRRTCTWLNTKYDLSKF